MNKKLWRIALTGALAMGIALCGAPTFAQDSAPQQPSQPTARRHRGRMNPEAQLARMTSRYNLTADQQSQIKPILEEQQTQMQALSQEQSTSREDRRSKMMSIRTDTNNKIRAVLNDEQKAKFDADQKRMQERMRQRMGGGGGGGSPQQ